MDCCPYETLNIKFASCNREEIKLAFLKLRAEYHPDKALGLSISQQVEAKEMFIRVNQSYQLLKNQRLKKVYIDALVYTEDEVVLDRPPYHNGWKAVQKEKYRIYQEESFRDDQQHMIEQNKKMERMMMDTYSATDDDKKEIQEESDKEFIRRYKAEVTETHRYLFIMEKKDLEAEAKKIRKRRKATAANDVDKVNKAVSIYVNDQDKDNKAKERSNGDMDNTSIEDDYKPYMDDCEEDKSSTDNNEDKEEDDTSDFELPQPKNRKLAEGSNDDYTKN